MSDAEQRAPSPAGEGPNAGSIDAVDPRHRMPPPIRWYVTIVDRFNYWIGRAVMYMIFVMIAVLFFSSIKKTFFDPALCTF